MSPYFRIAFVLPVLVAGCAGLPGTGFENVSGVNRSPSNPDIWIVENHALYVAVHPARGRMVSLGVSGGKNLLHQNPPDRSESASAAPHERWHNFGGDWVWPVQQSKWEMVDGPGIWPPPKIFFQTEWEGRAILEENGWVGVEMTVSYSEPLHIKVSRKFMFSDLYPGILEVHQSITRLAPSQIPVTLWHITQMRQPDSVRFDTGGPSRFPDGFRIIAPDPGQTAPLHLSKENGEFIWKPRPSNNSKFGTDGRKIRATRDRWTLSIEISEEHPQKGNYPDGGCSLAFFQGEIGPFVELETMSVEKHLAPGEHIHNRLRYHIIEQPE